MRNFNSRANIHLIFVLKNVLRIQNTVSLTSEIYSDDSIHDDPGFEQSCFSISRRFCEPDITTCFPYRESRDGENDFSETHPAYNTQKLYGGSSYGCSRD